MLAYLNQFTPDLLVEIKRKPDGMAHISATKVRSTDKVHEGMRTSIEVTCPKCLVSNLECRLKCQSGKSFPAVILLKGLCFTDRERRGPTKEHSLSEPV